MISCDVFYRIKFDNTDQSKYRLNIYYKHHTLHSFKIKKHELTPDDARYFISWCEKNDYNVVKYVNENEKHYIKFLITSTYMGKMYYFFGDIIVIDLYICIVNLV